MNWIVGVSKGPQTVYIYDVKYRTNGCFDICLFKQMTGRRARAPAGETNLTFGSADSAHSKS